MDIYGCDGVLGTVGECEMLLLFCTVYCVVLYDYVLGTMATTAAAAALLLAMVTGDA